MCNNIIRSLACVGRLVLSPSFYLCLPRRVTTNFANSIAIYFETWAVDSKSQSCRREWNVCCWLIRKCCSKIRRRHLAKQCLLRGVWLSVRTRIVGSWELCTKCKLSSSMSFGKSSFPMTLQSSGYIPFLCHPGSAHRMKMKLRKHMVVKCKYVQPSSNNR